MPYNSNEAPTRSERAVGTSAPEYAALRSVERRRHVLVVLSERTTSLELGELAAEIAAREAGVDAPPAAAPTDLTIDLHHVHLPKLAEAGVLDYDLESREVEPIAGACSADETDPTERSAAGADPSPGIDLREHVTAYFDASTGETASLDDLARYAAMRLSGTAEWSAERIRLRLHHAVLPRLADTGVLDYDSRTATVRYQTDSS